MLKGKKLKEGDTIGVVAPANSGSKEKVLRSKERLESLGYKVKLGKHIFDTWHSFAGTDKRRVSDINNFFKDPEVDAIMCLRGGYGSIRIVEDLDIEMIRKNPKVFIGYSDITTLHSALNQKAGLVTFHGPMAASNFFDIDKFTTDSFRKSVEGIQPGEIINPIELKSLAGGKAVGVVAGGNLTTLMADMGTTNELDFKGKILFVEEIREPTYKIDRALTQLLNSGKLYQLNGIILGDFNNCIPASEYDMNLMDLLEDRLENLGIPIIYNFQSGHCKPMVTLPLGIEIEIDCDELTIRSLEGAVR
ncbi:MULTISPECIES: S66 peptidase family protein [Psychrilyobacter]|uniref:LD-carboxypeptidase n=1 Tax=Psychrilyobacter piezotolerans TaxID=2293438 RepID=A0ABX9KFX7_9FUSO|nr:MULTISPECIES: LD-carboxypeptidase [Psychrilyobacter]MCS5422094.1 LD-carboxypeptidase [Psychrilyobacter sp. S5]NDI78382.1 LD-carboxypeptidase [Psychrilyobacter piezotolerans]RDE61108.1 LD-carboxypeptidase [Psychrilyobacter sp. S5]REI40749.1 LD-carboxypeptidase [Psychrilyobacter piezotolerans]